MDNDYKDMSLFEFIVLCIKKLGVLFKWLLNIIRHLIAICWKRWYIIAIGVILGFVFARFWIKPQFTLFTGEATIVFPDGMRRNIMEGVRCFENLAPEKKLSEYGIQYDIQERYRGMTTYNIIDAKCDSTMDYVDYRDKVEFDDSTQNISQNSLLLKIRFFGDEGIWVYEQTLSLFFNQNEMYAEPARRWRESMQRRIDAIDREIARTDSFVDYDYFHQRNTILVSDSIKLGHPAVMHYEDMLRLQREREYLVERLAMTPDVINFQTHIHTTAMALRDKYIYSLLVGFGLALLVSLIIEYRKEINRYLHPNR